MCGFFFVFVFFWGGGFEVFVVVVVVFVVFVVFRCIG